MKKVLLKISGEFFQGNGQAIHMPKVMSVAKEIKVLLDKKLKVAVVVGAGNIMRGGRVRSEVDRVTLDYAGMCGAVTNCLSLQAALNSLNVATVVDSTLNISQIGMYHRPLRAKQDYLSNRILLMGGTGLPYFSTDTAAVVFALELGAEVLLKATKVNGVYSADPKKNQRAERFSFLSFDEVLEKNLQVMDQTAFALARDNNLPIRVFKWQNGALKKLVAGEALGTLVS